MTDRELRKLSREELLEIMVAQGEEIERLRGELARLREEAENRQMAIDRAGTLAEAALRLNSVFEAADAAAQQYLENIESLSGRQASICAEMEAEAREKCARLEEETREHCRRLTEKTRQDCERMVSLARQQSENYWSAVYAQAEKLES